MTGTSAASPKLIPIHVRACRTYPATPPLRLATAFDALAWQQDLARSTDEGRNVARAARGRYEKDGILAHDLRPCEAGARDGTTLPGGFKAYLPPPAGRFGTVFQFRRAGDQAVLIYLAFGVRHHPPNRTRPPSTSSPTNGYRAACSGRA